LWILINIMCTANVRGQFLWGRGQMPWGTEIEARKREAEWFGLEALTSLRMATSTFRVERCWSSHQQCYMYYLHYNNQQPPFYGHLPAHPAKNWRILLVQSFTARMPLLTTSASGLGEYAWVLLNSIIYTVVVPYSTALSPLISHKSSWCLDIQISLLHGIAESQTAMTHTVQGS